MTRPLVTTVDGVPAGIAAKPAGPTLLILFNDKAGPQQVIDIVASRHAFIESQTYDTRDEQDRPAWLLVLTCETATATELFDMIGSRLPDYIQARRYPASRLPEVRRASQR